MFKESKLCSICVLSQISAASRLEPQIERENETWLNQDFGTYFVKERSKLAVSSWIFAAIPTKSTITHDPLCFFATRGSAF